MDFANTPAATPVTLWGKGSLGVTATDKDLVKATKLPTSPSRGALAWAVMDEGVKVRINTPYDDTASTTGEKIAQLGAGERPGVELIAGLNGLERKFFEMKSHLRPRRCQRASPNTTFRWRENWSAARQFRTS